MDWKAALVTFALIFFAEIGDKTQLTTMTLAAHSRSPWTVFIGAMAALALACLLGVLAGEAVLRFIPQRVVNLIAGIGFIALGLLLVWGGRV